jgi:hypothetical protein
MPPVGGGGVPVEQHAAVLADRLERLASVTTNVTTGKVARGNETPRVSDLTTGLDIPPSGRRDSNPGPPAPKAGALPDCATPRHAV